MAVVPNANTERLKREFGQFVQSNPQIADDYSEDQLSAMLSGDININDAEYSDALMAFYSSLNSSLMNIGLEGNSEEITAAEFKYTFRDSIVEHLGFNDSIVISESDLEKIFEELDFDGDGVLSTDELEGFESKDEMKNLFKEQDISLEGQLGNMEDNLLKDGENSNANGAGNGGGGGGHPTTSPTTNPTEDPNSQYDGEGSTPQEKANDLRTNVIPGLQDQASGLEDDLNTAFTEEGVLDLLSQDLKDKYNNNETAITETETFVSEQDAIVAEQSGIITTQEGIIATETANIANIQAQIATVNSMPDEGGKQQALSALQSALQSAQERKEAAETAKAAAKLKKDAAQMLKNTAELKLHMELEPEKIEILAEILETDGLSDEAKSAIATYAEGIVEVNYGIMAANSNLDYQEELIEEDQNFPEENLQDENGNMIDINGNIIDENNDDAQPAAALPTLTEDQIQKEAETIEGYFEQGREDFVGIENLASYFNGKDYSEADLYAIQEEIRKRIDERANQAQEEPQE